MLVDKSDEETVEEDTQVEQTSAASLAWVLDTCAEAVVELRRSSTGATRSHTPSLLGTRRWTRTIRKERNGNGTRT